ncbi:nuclear transport factor 2 family protein [Natronospirillum operosum]|uniref:Nuclear transport factor 2 family protein n=1 Tax=Natronospirillum operosum TaxID=2759953 RepID=A0A4Z0WDA2_9GAMM|nr:nuclear transport factor 2 family protein [Natronospirillum operosum]TGG91754.1 nuclear transport factor 2 family protein [Natronospirillum operosum]
MALETRVWEALRTGNAELDAALLADHFLGVYPSGFATRQEHCGQLSEGPTVAAYELRTPRLTVMRDDLVLFSYLAVWSRLQDGQPQVSEKMYVSSIWQRIGDNWLNTFSQDTPAS